MGCASIATGGAAVDERVMVWSEGVRVRAFEVGPDGVAGMPSLCDWLQEAAGNHASALTWGVENLQTQHLTWVLARLHLRVARWPRWREDLTVRTWPSGVVRAFAVREFRVDLGEESLAVGTSGWVVLDTAARRPVRPGADLAEMASLTPPRVLADAFERLTEVPPAATAFEVRVGRSDLDLNGHANNVRFVAWALDGLPAAVADASTLGELEIDYRAEAREGDVLVVEAAPGGEPDTWLHRITRPADGRELARARTRWRPGRA
ncbi:MAG: thioesterase [Thermoanaerobaculaceae bacterium]|nr:thioesterase [Thermoanaerobaculaceae bacterium]